MAWHFLFFCVYKQGRFCLCASPTCSHEIEAQEDSASRAQPKERPSAQIWRQTVKVLPLSHSFFWLLVLYNILGLLQSSFSVAICPWEQEQPPTTPSKMESPTLCFSQTFLQLFFPAPGLQKPEEKKLLVNFFCKFWQRQMTNVFVPIVTFRLFWFMFCWQVLTCFDKLLGEISASPMGHFEVLV